MSAAGRCQFWLPQKRRHCANSSLPPSQFCGNHGGSAGRRVPCPVDPSHTVLEEGLEAHVARCPRKKLADALESQPYYSKGANAGDVGETVAAASKRAALYKLGEDDFRELVNMIRSIHERVVVPLQDAYRVPAACEKWLHRQIDRRLPYQERHVAQQASILGNMEVRGMLRKRPQEGGNEPIEDETEGPAVVEFGAGRGYLTQMLADCYVVRRVILIERRSYKLKADRSLRQNERITLDRLRIDIEDLSLFGIESLRNSPYIAIGKHLCGPATDMTIRCCLNDQRRQMVGRSVDGFGFQGLALATCCHHLCQWKHYINKEFLYNLGITEDIFHAITWFSSWAVDGDHSVKLPAGEGDEQGILQASRPEDDDRDTKGSERIMRGMPAEERTALGFMCKDIIDAGRLAWLRGQELDADLVKYAPSEISPENHLLIAGFKS